MSNVIQFPTTNRNSAGVASTSPSALAQLTAKEAESLRIKLKIQEAIKTHIPGEVRNV